jgi:hypothetical protein
MKFMSDRTKRTIAQTIAEILEKGIQADVWYDADDHNDEDAELVINETQDAMSSAATYLLVLESALQDLGVDVDLLLSKNGQ